MVERGELVQQKDGLYVVVPQSELYIKSLYLDGKDINCGILSDLNANECLHAFFMNHIVPFIKTADNLYSEEDKEFHIPLIFQSKDFF